MASCEKLISSGSELFASPLVSKTGLQVNPYCLLFCCTKEMILALLHVHS